MRLNYLIMRQGCHNYERPAHGTGGGVAATNEARSDGVVGGPTRMARPARIVGGVIE